MREEHLHHVLIGVTLGQRQPHVPLRRDGGDHVDSVAHWSVGHRVVLAPPIPACPPVVGRGHPGLVDVDDKATLAVYREHLLRVETAQYSVPLRVAYEGNSFDLSVPQPELFLDQACHCSRGDVKVCPLLDLRFDLLHRPDTLFAAE